MIVDPAATAQRDVYKILIGSVVPRPIGFISSISLDRPAESRAVQFFQRGVRRSADGFLFHFESASRARIRI